jgi:2,3-bisphosphoglycerate-independent phosphoglycerate mutase
MYIEKILPELIQKNDKKILLVVMDGLGGMPSEETGLTELESAKIPNLDKLAQEASVGLMVPVAAGVTPGSGPAHLGLFGYDPIEYQIGRGILECLGIGMHVGRDDLAIRGNFASINDAGIVIDRRAGRIPTDENKRLAEVLQKEIPEVQGVKITVQTVKEHRCAILLQGKNLSPSVTENDPQKEGLPLRELAPHAKDGTFTASVLAEFETRVQAALKPAGSKANTLLLRGFSKLPHIPTFEEKYGLKPACIATYPMYKGLSKLVGMDILTTGDSLDDEFETLRKAYDQYDFFYLHIKKTDAMGEDGNFAGKVQALEYIDSKIMQARDLAFESTVITGDHSTPARLKGHSWHPVPFLLISPNALPDTVARFTERECSRGILGLFHSTEAICLMLACALKLQKFGA